MIAGRRRPRVELLWWEGCPSTDKALAELRSVLTELGLSEVEIVSTEIRSDAEARRMGFAGSPTILIDGVDLAPGADDPAGLNCRVYRRRDGRISPVPDPDDVREALRAATARNEVAR